MASFLTTGNINLQCVSNLFHLLTVAQIPARQDARPRLSPWGLIAKDSVKANSLATAALALCGRVEPMTFAGTVAVVYNPLAYAWDVHASYLERFGPGRKRVLFLGMNPGPFGMAQTGVPFGEIAAVRDWMGLSGSIGQPPMVHPKRPVLGFGCKNSEVSGRRFWGLMAERFGSAAEFFSGHFVANYCPLVFMEASGRNVTPDKLQRTERDVLYDACDRHLQDVVDSLHPDWCIGVGGFAAGCFTRIDCKAARVGTILHPSPASPAANRGWSAAATRQLEALGVW